MIEKNEIMMMANGWSLTPDSIEKDYVLGWLLWGIHNHKELSNAWLFNGGTSLKKESTNPNGGPGRVAAVQTLSHQQSCF